MNNKIRIAFVGNPNCGKTTLFNGITGSNLKVANWPGVTVEKKTGSVLYENFEMELIDTPGIYSLSTFTIEEKVTRECLLNDEIDVIVNVIDASNLERNLYLTLQLIELGKPTILALNMMDIVRETGLEIDLHRLPEMLGNIPVVPVSAAKKTGFDILLHAVSHHITEPIEAPIFFYEDNVERCISAIQNFILKQKKYRFHPRWISIKILEEDQQITKEFHEAAIFYKEYSHENLKDDLDLPGKIIQGKYNYIEEIIEEVLFYKEEKAATTDRVDRYLTHPKLGLPIFFGIMALVFFLTFQIGDVLKGILEKGISAFSDLIEHGLIYLHVSDWMLSLIVDGIVNGVGGILTFIPNIAILFIALAILEDSGYMARVAYVMDKRMGKAGLSGKAFVPMILGFGCTVPAIMAARTLESEKDRRRVILLTPFMSCSAKLPIYVIFSQAFFPQNAFLVAFSMYVLGMMLAVCVAFVLHRFDGKSDNESLLIELPEYKRPNIRTVRIYVFQKLSDYILRAGTTIFLASLIIWIILNFGLTGFVTDSSNSIGAVIGTIAAPLLIPCGLNMWQLVLALISGITAKEVVVSSLSVLAGTNGELLTSQTLHQFLISVNPDFTWINAYSFLLFSLLYVPCIASIVTIKKESNSILFTIKVLIFQIVLAWSAATIFYQTATLLRTFFQTI